MWDDAEVRRTGTTRRFFIMASVLSILLCAGTCFFILLSYSSDRGFLLIHGAWSGQGPARGFDQWKLQVRARRGILYVSGERSLDDTVILAEIRSELGYRRLLLSRGDDLDVLLGRVLGFGYVSHSFPVHSNGMVVHWWRSSVPLWLFAVPFAFVPTLLIRRRLRRRAPILACSHCGYDLRATPDRCPECGTVICCGAEGNRMNSRPLVLRLMVLLCLATAGCQCASESDQAQLQRYGGLWVPGGPFSACDAQWLWFDPKKRQITDDEFAAMLPAIKRLHPPVLQLYGQKQISDRSIAAINQLPSVTTILIGETAITEAGLRRLRPGIQVDQSSGYRPARRGINDPQRFAVVSALSLVLCVGATAARVCPTHRSSCSPR